MYKIIGADQKEYGPITAEQLRQWLAEGRVNLQTKVLPESATEWKTVGDLPETTKYSSRQLIAIGISLGLALGAGLGAAMNNLAMGIGIGVAFGAAIGAALTCKKGKND